MAARVVTCCEHLRLVLAVPGSFLPWILATSARMTNGNGCNPTLVMAALVAAIYALMRRRLWRVLVDPRDEREDDQ
jgi:hypothetical protein